MLDMVWIRENEELVRQTAKWKKVDFPLDELLEWDDRRRGLRQETEELRARRNALTKEVETLLRQGNRAECETVKEQVRELGGRLTDVEARLAESETKCRELMLRAPNPVSQDTPIGESDKDNVEVRRCGEPPAFGFTLRDHVELGELHDIIDIPRGVKAGGPRSYTLKGTGLYLHLAVQRLALDVLAARGFTVMDVPTIVRPETLVRTGFFPGGEDQTYELSGENRWLAGTSEVPLVSLYSDEIIDLAAPMRLAGMSACFRREVGSAGRDVRGLYRVHQFSKIEQVVLCENDPEVSESMLQEILANAEHILQLLELPYRVVAVCTGDMSLKTHKQYDIETWMPGRNAYGETHSASNLLDFQARRSNIRYRGADGKLRYCHTLNNTAAATPRILIPLLENHQREDGSIYIPQALRKYMDGREVIPAPQPARVLE
ncbi:seryl-tRNA synthetase [Paenibacillus sophorae]|uniref:Serine--tRNA ligase n=1 Tax=Paenibacillus sophorae TaxID=1333845 RepID=A0A1H8PMI6_9BACL|nr:serine--tRNA ligase [Paenibacillus sophorae]QWU16633.1 serine--tRNA ligase [Paenibacillus sophorae]SEO43229.1 seryl-tRNA synthetase [Paenibacillus sophorae]